MTKEEFLAHIDKCMDSLFICVDFDGKQSLLNCLGYLEDKVKGYRRGYPLPWIYRDLSSFFYWQIKNHKIKLEKNYDLSHYYRYHLYITLRDLLLEPHSDLVY
jgi:hypothetical protein